MLGNKHTRDISKNNSIPNTSGSIPKEYFSSEVKTQESKAINQGWVTAHQLVIYVAKNRNVEDLGLALSQVNKGASMSLTKSYEEG